MSATAPYGLPAGAERLGRYRLLQRVGEGGMGVVHLAVDDAGRTVAVKVLRPHVAGDPSARRRLAREVSTLRRVRHPRVAEVLDADTDGPVPYLVTRYVPGPPLDVHLRGTGALSGVALARLGDGLGEALAAIHAAGVVHRDLKPANVLVLDGEPQVIDFGIAHVADDVRLTTTGLVMGTPGYLSPEVLCGEDVSEATDWWGWAATMAFAATGRPPFGRGPSEVVLDRVRRGETDLDGVPAALVDVLARALDVAPSRRPAPGELRVAVERLRLAGRAGAAADPVTRPVPAPVITPPAPAVAWTGAPTVATPVVVPVTRQMPVYPAPSPPAAATTPVSRPPPAPVRRPPPAPVVPWPQPQPQPQPRPQPAPLPAPARPARTPRTGTLWAGLLAYAVLAGVVPVVAVYVGFVGSVLARTVDRTSGAMVRRRYERGPGRSDVLVATLASPLRLLSAALVSVPALLLPLAAGVSTAFVVGWGVAPGDAVAPGESLPLAAGALVGAVVAWFGPGGGSLRRGTRTVVRRTSPGRTGSRVAVAVLLVIAVGGLLVVFDTGGQPDWAPREGPPFTGSP